ncbi:hypothetical protein DY000_02054492 [Brassica cretica]|uniref:Thioredoxin-like fold domain-containing protein n=1 Tax=Brassica cretica TaxID=69181 RepID=A0ABQ7ADR6_BRACR|nr:hypothetical protein DY000_02054492 [Brassica cretica]
MNLPVVACIAPRTPMLHTGLNSRSSDTNRSSTLFFTARIRSRNVKPLAAVSSDSAPDPESNLKPKKEATESENFPTKVPRKPKRGRRSEADAVEDFVRSSLEKTFSSIREQNPEVFENKEKASFIKDRGEESEGEMVVEEEDPDWPVDTDVGWGIKASEYFDTHPIKNVVGEDGTVIDWEGEIDDSWVKEINCLEWESFAFHPSPLVVLAVKIDLNIETDLAYALKAKECPQILFLRGNRILYREKEVRSADELVQMIAHFYYKAKRPSWIDKANVTPYC